MIVTKHIQTDKTTTMIKRLLQSLFWAGMVAIAIVVPPQAFKVINETIVHDNERYGTVAEWYFGFCAICSIGIVITSIWWFFKWLFTGNKPF